MTFFYGWLAGIGTFTGISAGVSYYAIRHPRMVIKSVMSLQRKRSA